MNEKIENNQMEPSNMNEKIENNQMISNECGKIAENVGNRHACSLRNRNRSI